MKSEPFWSWFNETVRARLGPRGDTFARMFEHLDRLDGAFDIIETGCVRTADNFAGDGCSTILFDKYTEAHGSTLYTVDIDPISIGVCRKLVSDRVKIHTGDSVAYFRSLAVEKNPIKIGLLYLDSTYDDVNTLKEFTAISPLVRKNTLVAVDDSALLFEGVVNADQQIQLLHPPKIGGKGKILAEYAHQVGATLEFSYYQCGWTNLGIAT